MAAIVSKAREPGRVAKRGSEEWDGRFTENTHDPVAVLIGQGLALMKFVVFSHLRLSNYQVCTRTQTRYGFVGSGREAGARRMRFQWMAALPPRINSPQQRTDARETSSLQLKRNTRA